MAAITPDDIVLLISPDHKRFVLRLTPGDEFHTHRGIIPHDDILGQPFGSRIPAHTGAEFVVLKPSFEELLMSVTRATQILYPKDIGYILLKLSVYPGVRVVEAGTGSGAMTMALARYSSPGGHVYTYEARDDMHRLAQRNLANVGLDSEVTFHLADIESGFVEREVDAVFLDVREPWDYLPHVAEALAAGGHFGCLVPTNNQLIEVVRALKNGPFEDLEVSELLLRQYKPVPDRLRPLDRLTPHTGYLTFARRVGGSPESGEIG